VTAAAAPGAAARAAAAETERDPRDCPLPPGPSRLTAPKVALDFFRDPYVSIPKLARKYGDVVTIPFGVMRTILVSHPDHVHHVLTRHTDRYAHNREGLVRADAIVETFSIQGDTPLPALDGPKWKKHRKAMQPHFTGKALRDVGGLVSEALADGVSQWEAFADTGETIDLQDEFGVLAMSTLMRSHFSAALSRSEVQDWVHRSHVHGRFVGKAAPTGLLLERLPWGMAAFRAVPWPHLRGGRRNLDAMCATLDRLIENRKANPQPEHDILHYLLESTFDDGTSFTHGELRAEMMALMFAGFDTTAAVLSWTFGLFAANPGPLAQAYAEVDALGLGAEPVTAAHLERLPYLRACFDEAQRIQGSLPLNGRWAKQDDVIGGYRIPKGTMVIASPLGLGMDPRFWKNPEEFRPRRFLDDEINKNAFIPFGIGPRRCVGVNLAYMEGVLTLATVLQRYRIEVPPDWKPKRVFTISNSLESLPAKIWTR